MCSKWLPGERVKNGLSLGGGGIEVYLYNLIFQCINNLLLLLLLLPLLLLLLLLLLLHTHTHIFLVLQDGDTTHTVHEYHLLK